MLMGMCFVPRLLSLLTFWERPVCALQDTCCFVDIAGQQANTTQAVAQLLQQDAGSQAHQAQLQPFDHILVPEGATVKRVQAALEEGSARVAVLYGAVGTAAFAGMHQQLLDAAGRVTFKAHMGACTIFNIKI